jgi:hypothetical protein
LKICFHDTKVRVILRLQTGILNEFYNEQR